MADQPELVRYATEGNLEALRKVQPLSLLSKPDATGTRLIHVAAANGRTSIVEWLVEDEKRDTGVNKPDEDARGPLHLAAWHGKSDTVRALLEMGALRDRPTRTGFTPLHYVSYLRYANSSVSGRHCN
jgi:ankyrin repeat protein